MTIVLSEEHRGGYAKEFGLPTAASWDDIFNRMPMFRKNFVFKSVEFVFVEDESSNHSLHNPYYHIVEDTEVKLRSYRCCLGYKVVTARCPKGCWFTKRIEAIGFAIREAYIELTEANGNKSRRSP